MDNKIRNIIVNHIKIKRQYEKITHTEWFYEYNPYIDKKDTKIFLKICDDLKEAKKEMIKEVWYWNYFLYSNFFFKSYFFKKFNLIWEKD